MSQRNDQNESQLMLNTLVRAIQTCIWNYPTYNYLTQHQNFLRQQIVDRHPNPLLKKGQKYYSQNDEDGILLEVLKRIGLLDSINNKVFIEYGVGNGLENNTLILLMLGWVGAWVGNEELAFNNYNEARLFYNKEWITLDNFEKTYTKSQLKFDINEFDLLSLDLDGNDYHFLKSILVNAHRPKIIIVEYNAKFPPPIEFTVKYNPDHKFTNDYMGASLQMFCNLLNEHEYFLVACNITGSNAFFVKKEFRHHFADIPQAIDELYVPANYGIVTKVGHPASPETVRSFILPME